MVADIREDIARGTDFDPRIHKAIVNAIRFYRARKYGFNTGRNTVLVTAERTSLSVDMLAVDSAVLQVDGVRLRDLAGRTSRWIDGQKVSETWESEPIYYAPGDRQIRLYPPPDRSYSVELHGHMDFLNISLSTSTSTTTNPWMT